MAALHIRQFPETLHRRLAKLAEEEHRSLSAEVVVLLERTLAQPLPSQHQVLAQLERSRFRPFQGKKVPSSLELLKADRQR